MMDMGTDEDGHVWQQQKNWSADQILGIFLITM